MTTETSICSAMALVIGFAAGAIWANTFGVSEEESRRRVEQTRRELEERDVVARINTPPEQK